MSRARTVTVYRERGRVEETCAFGETHEVAYYEVKRLTDTGLTRPYDNGYEVLDTGLFVDAQGRTYHQHVEVDYFDNIAYVRDEPGSEPGPRFKPRTRPLARDLLGRPLTSKTPAGPPWVGR